MKLNFYTSANLVVAPNWMMDRLRGVISRSSQPTGGPWVEHQDGQLTIGYYGTDHVAKIRDGSQELNETINIIMTDGEFDQLVTSVRAARNGNFIELAEARRHARNDGRPDVVQA